MYSQVIQSISALNAENDRHFQEHFVATKYLKRLDSPNCDIIFGSKGVGKTALCRALSEFNGHKFYKAITIDLDLISFEAVYGKLLQLNSTIKNELHLLSRSVWMNTLISYGLLAFSETLNDEDSLKLKIIEILKEDKFLKSNERNENTTSNYRLLNAIENIFKKISGLAIIAEKTEVSLSPEQQDIINLIPINESISKLLVAVIKLIKQSGKKILICIDGFDSILRHDANSRQAIFAGLIDSVYRFHKNESISDAFCFKAFLPLELTIEANAITSDGDKYTNRVHYLSWEVEDFKNFIFKRLHPYSKKKANKFNDIWNEYMPDKILNSVHNVEEQTFDYILRHTLYRPRQIMDHIQNLFSLWTETSNSNTKIQPSFIPQAIARRNNLMAGKIAEYLENVYPNLLNFLKSWQGSNTIIEANKFKDKIVRYFSETSNSIPDTDKLFDEFFNIGFFGVHAGNDMHSITKKIDFKFAFVGDNLNSHIASSVKDNDLVAFAPMFREFCGCKSSYAIINPVSVDFFDY